MAIVFSFGAAAYWALGTFGKSPVTFIITAGLVYFTWGEIYSLFPATCTDTYGSKYATTNAGLALHRQRHGVLPGAAGQLAARPSTGSWHAVFVVATIANYRGRRLRLFIVKPMRARQTAATVAPRPVRASRRVSAIRSLVKPIGPGSCLTRPISFLRYCRRPRRRASPGPGEGSNSASCAAAMTLSMNAHRRRPMPERRLAARVAAPLRRGQKDRAVSLVACRRHGAMREEIEAAVVRHRERYDAVQHARIGARIGVGLLLENGARINALDRARLRSLRIIRAPCRVFRATVRGSASFPAGP